MTRPEDVADALSVLATPQTHWMTGNVLGVDGGEVMGTRESAESA
jgi:NAD(P)-dependent dehydrogenase (short-subunit alcohol dehydrogenase family)